MLKDQNLANELIESINIAKQATVDLYTQYTSKEFNAFRETASLLKDFLRSLGLNLKKLTKENPHFEDVYIGYIKNVIASLEQICIYEKARSNKTLSKLEFELLPVLEQFYVKLYFMCFIDGDIQKGKEFTDGLWHQLKANRYIDESERTGKYKYDVSIFVFAYNKLEYTKACVEAILKNTSANINYELILVNHGSTDGTKEYFESIGCTKQLDFKYNNLKSTATGSVFRILEGKYYCFISNDVLVGPNYLDNLIKCIEEDPTIKVVVPTTTNISNFQTIPCDFKNMDEMWKFAKKNNVYNKFRHERRTRVMNPIEFGRTADIVSTKGMGHVPVTMSGVGFGEDIKGIRINRAGGKCVLAKDSFCYHFGEVTLREEPNYRTPEWEHERKQVIRDYYGVEPWGTGCCYDLNLFKNFICEKQGHAEILGINCGFGSNSLKIKEAIKENSHNLDTHLLNITDAIEYELDQKGISDSSAIITEKSDIDKILDSKKFDYIIWDADFKIDIDKEQLFKQLKLALTDDGFLIISKFTINKELEKSLKEVEYWFIYQN